ncbi:MAG TPA: hypothetical protein VMY06_10920, partial [Sedimentisphaerales bacterium]|nr:hypothetical protein [Sedimentisphaerales bacterium]
MNKKTFLLTAVALLFAVAQALALVDEELHPGPQGDSQALPGTVTELPIARTIALPGTWPYGLAFDGTAVWHTDGDTDTIYRLDPADGTVLDSTPSPASHPTGLAWYDGNITQWHGLWNCDYNNRIYHVVSPLHSIPAP